MLCPPAPEAAKLEAVEVEPELAAHWGRPPSLQSHRGQRNRKAQYSRMAAQCEQQRHPRHRPRRQAMGEGRPVTGGSPQSGDQERSGDAEAEGDPVAFCGHYV